MWSAVASATAFERLKSGGCATALHMRCFCRVYFPMQNFVKISVKMSSRVMAPVRRPRALAAR